MEIPSCCPHCDEPYRWEIDLKVDRELAWMAPNSPGFAFLCAHCGGQVEVTFDWSLEQGSDAHRLLLVGGATPLRPRPNILLVDLCPHGCGAKLGLQLDPDDPWARGVASTALPIASCMQMRTWGVSKCAFAACSCNRPTRRSWTRRFAPAAAASIGRRRGKFLPRRCNRWMRPIRALSAYDVGAGTPSRRRCRRR